MCGEHIRMTATCGSLLLLSMLDQPSQFVLSRLEVSAYRKQCQQMAVEFAYPMEECGW